MNKFSEADRIEQFEKLMNRSRGIYRGVVRS